MLCYCSFCNALLSFHFASFWYDCDCSYTLFTLNHFKWTSSNNLWACCSFRKILYSSWNHTEIFTFFCLPSERGKKKSLRISLQNLSYEWNDLYFGCTWLRNRIKKRFKSNITNAAISICLCTCAFFFVLFRLWANLTLWLCHLIFHLIYSFLSYLPCQRYILCNGHGMTHGIIDF